MVIYLLVNIFNSILMDAGIRKVDIIYVIDEVLGDIKPIYPNEFQQGIDNKGCIK